MTLRDATGESFAIQRVRHFMKVFDQCAGQRIICTTGAATQLLADDLREVLSALSETPQKTGLLGDDVMLLHWQRAAYPYFTPTELKNALDSFRATVPSAIARSDDAKDAARYRWLRDYGHSRIVTGTASMSTGRGPYIRFDPPANNQFSGMTLWNEGADAAVDEAMK